MATVDDRPRKSERANSTQRPTSQLTPGNSPRADDDLDVDECGSDSPDALTDEDLDEALKQDAKLRHELYQDGFQGPNWDRFADELVKYGHAVVGSWLQTHKMWKECKKKGRYPGPPPLSWNEEDRDELANETIAWALIVFHDEGMQRERWKPEHGASLQTYFIGACVLVFPNVYRKWLRERPPKLEIVDDKTANSLASTTLQDPEYVATSNIWLEEYLNSITDEQTKQVVFLRYMGYPIGKIAEILQTDKKSIEECLRRERKRHLKLRRGRGECNE
jgi:DNA-directed RNA polymerase specialized sigma24 family protein